MCRNSPTGRRAAAPCHDHPEEQGQTWAAAGPKDRNPPATTAPISRPTSPRADPPDAPYGSPVAPPAVAGGRLSDEMLRWHRTGPSNRTGHRRRASCGGFTTRRGRHDARPASDGSLEPKKSGTAGAPPAAVSQHAADDATRDLTRGARPCGPQPPSPCGTRAARRPRRT